MTTATRPPTTGPGIDRTFRTWDERRVGDLVYRPFSIDHSIPAAYGFIIHAGGKTVVYTGDLRCHGTMRHLTERFLRAVKEESVDVMLCEGTNLAPERRDTFLREFEREYRRRMGKAAPERVERRCETEEDVEREMRRLVEDLEGLVLVETCPADIDRIRTLWKVARSTGRRLILDSRQSYLTYELDKRDPRVKDLPGPREICLKFYSYWMCYYLLTNPNWIEILAEPVGHAQYTERILDIDEPSE